MSKTAKTTKPIKIINAKNLKVALLCQISNEEERQLDKKAIPVEVVLVKDRPVLFGYTVISDIKGRKKFSADGDCYGDLIIPEAYTRLFNAYLPFEDRKSTFTEEEAKQAFAKIKGQVVNQVEEIVGKAKVKTRNNY